MRLQLTKDEVYDASIEVINANYNRVKDNFNENKKIATKFQDLNGNI